MAQAWHDPTALRMRITTHDSQKYIDMCLECKRKECTNCVGWMKIKARMKAAKKKKDESE